MIVFDKTLLKNTLLFDEAIKLAESGFIDKEELQKKTAKIPILKSQNNLLIRLCFFILGVLAFASMCGFIALIALDGIDSNWTIFLVVYASMGIVFQEFLFARNSNFYGFGLDDAFILCTIGVTAAYISETTNTFENYSSNTLAISISVFIFSTLAYLRYLHIPSLLISCLSFVSVLFFFIFENIQFGQQIMPFVLFFTGILLFYFSKKTISNILQPFYENGLLVVSYFGLLLAYFAMNYLVVRELSALLENKYYEVSPQIPMAWIFYAFTFIIPAIYIFFSLKNKDRILLYVGLFSLGFSILTFRTYHHILPTEWAMLLGGIVLFSIAYFSILKLKNKERGITFMKDKFSSTNSLLNLELVATATTMGMKPEIKTPDSSMEFGGGGYSGGGGGGNF